MEKYGFIYLWYDKKYKKFYIGRHWGSVDDGYVCSSKTMREAYRRRPNDFKRRIINKVTDKNRLVIEEQRWLDMIKKNEVGVRYYNKTLKSTTPSTNGYKHSKETIEKIRTSNVGRIVSEETKKKLRESAKQQFSKDENRKLVSEKTKQMWQNEGYAHKVRQAMKNGVTDEVRRIRSENANRVNKLRWNRSTE